MSSLKLILFDIDGTLLDTGGAGARSWTWAFEHFFDRPGVDIGKYSSAGMTDPVGRAKFDAWEKQRGVPAEKAKAEYVELVRSLIAG